MQNKQQRQKIAYGSSVLNNAADNMLSLLRVMPVETDFDYKFKQVSCRRKLLLTKEFFDPLIHAMVTQCQQANKIIKPGYKLVVNINNEAHIHGAIAMVARFIYFGVCLQTDITCYAAYLLRSQGFIGQISMLTLQGITGVKNAFRKPYLHDILVITNSDKPFEARLASFDSLPDDSLIIDLGNCKAYKPAEYLDSTIFLAITREYPLYEILCTPNFIAPEVLVAFRQSLQNFLFKFTPKFDRLIRFNKQWAERKFAQSVFVQSDSTDRYFVPPVIDKLIPLTSLSVISADTEASLDYNGHYRNTTIPFYMDALVMQRPLASEMRSQRSTQAIPTIDLPTELYPALGFALLQNYFSPAKHVNNTLRAAITKKIAGCSRTSLSLLGQCFADGVSEQLKGTSLLLAPKNGMQAAPNHVNERMTDTALLSIYHHLFGTAEFSQHILGLAGFVCEDTQAQDGIVNGVVDGDKDIGAHEISGIKTNKTLLFDVSSILLPEAGSSEKKSNTETHRPTLFARNGLRDNAAIVRTRTLLHGTLEHCRIFDNDSIETTQLIETIILFIDALSKTSSLKADQKRALLADFSKMQDISLDIHANRVNQEAQVTSYRQLFILFFDYINDSNCKPAIKNRNALELLNICYGCINRDSVQASNLDNTANNQLLITAHRYLEVQVLLQYLRRCISCLRHGVYEETLGCDDFTDEETDLLSTLLKEKLDGLSEHHCSDVTIETAPQGMLICYRLYTDVLDCRRIRQRCLKALPNATVTMHKMEHSQHRYIHIDNIQVMDVVEAIGFCSNTLPHCHARQHPVHGLSVD